MLGTSELRVYIVINDSRFMKKAYWKITRLIQKMMFGVMEVEKYTLHNFQRIPLSSNRDVNI